MTKDQQRLYLARAEFRYELWIDASAKTYALTPPLGNSLSPSKPHSSFAILLPLDVAYVWHTHMLSPFRYYEDLDLRLRADKKLFDTPLPLSAIVK